MRPPTTGPHPPPYVLACHCCGGPFFPRTEDNAAGWLCCSGATGVYCVNCLKCQKHCTCRGPKVRSYVAAWQARQEVFSDSENMEDEDGLHTHKNGSV